MPTLQLTAATSAREEAQEKLKAEQAAHAALKVESGKLLEGVQAQMTGAVSQLTAQVKELSGKLAATSKQLAESDKERKLYIEAVRMLKLRLTDADAKVKDFASKRMLYESEIERLSEWVAEHTIAGAKVTQEMESIPQARAIASLRPSSTVWSDCPCGCLSVVCGEVAHPAGDLAAQGCRVADADQGGDCRRRRLEPCRASQPQEHAGGGQASHAG